MQVSLMVRKPLVCFMKQKGQALTTALGKAEPETLKIKVLLIGLSGRSNCHSQGDKDPGSIGPFSLARALSLQAALHCPMLAPLPLQAADIHLAFPPSPHPGIIIPSLMALHPSLAVA